MESAGMLHTVQYNSTYQDAGYMDRLGRLGKFSRILQN